MREERGSPLTYLMRLICSAREAQSALALDDPFPGANPPPTLVGNELPRPFAAGIREEPDWELLLYTETLPDAGLQASFLGFSARQQTATPERLPDADWVTLSQAGLAPVDIGRIHIHTATHRKEEKPGQWPIEIDAGLAFGTGQHATTAGCVRMALRLAKQRNFHDILDVGTGSGVLSFAAHRLWHASRITATDIDRIAVRVARENARINHQRTGRTRGSLSFVAARGVRHPLVAQRQPYDLAFANILMRPLLAIAPGLAALVANGGFLVLAGLLRHQIRTVLAAYAARGLHLAAPPTGGEWPVLLLRKGRSPECEGRPDISR